MRKFFELPVKAINWVFKSRLAMCVAIVVLSVWVFDRTLEMVIGDADLTTATATIAEDNNIEFLRVRCFRLSKDGAFEECHGIDSREDHVGFYPNRNEHVIFADGEHVAIGNLVISETGDLQLRPIGKSESVKPFPINIVDKRIVINFL